MVSSSPVASGWCSLSLIDIGTSDYLFAGWHHAAPRLATHAPRSKRRENAMLDSTIERTSGHLTVMPSRDEQMPVLIQMF